MKMFVGYLLVEILNKMGFSVVVGCKIDGSITLERGYQILESNDFTKARLFYENGQEFWLPEGKFEMRSTYSEDSNEYKEWYRKVVNKKNKG